MSGLTTTLFCSANLLALTGCDDLYLTDSTSGGASSANSITNSGGSTSDENSTTGGATAFDSSKGDASSSGGAVSNCPNPISKPEALLAAEPTPENQCARVSNVIVHRDGYYAFGFTNGEIFIMKPGSPPGIQRVDTWTQSGVAHALPSKLVTAMAAPEHNNEGALYVAYADSESAATSIWYAGMAGLSWKEQAVEQPGTALALYTCPFHNGSDSHRGLAIPWITQETGVASDGYSSINTVAMNRHMKLTGYVTTVERITAADGIRLFVGTDSGQVFKSGLITKTPTWNDTTETLDGTVVWEGITSPEMPSSWVTRVTVHPVDPNRVFAVFARWNTTDAIWFSDDGGATWSNRHANLPITSDPIRSPPLIAASFNPIQDGAAYVVTPQTSYYTTDYGASDWKEW